MKLSVKRADCNPIQRGPAFFRQMISKLLATVMGNKVTVVLMRPASRQSE